MDSAYLDRVRRQAALWGVEVAPLSVGPHKFLGRTPWGWVPFGARGYDDFMLHGDVRRRGWYAARHGAIRTADGQRAVDIPYTPAWLSWRILWALD